MVTLSYILADSTVFIVGGFMTEALAQAWADKHMPAGATAVITPMVIAPTIGS